MYTTEKSQHQKVLLDLIITSWLVSCMLLKHDANPWISRHPHFSWNPLPLHPSPTAAHGRPPALTLLFPTLGYAALFPGREPGAGPSAVLYTQ